jgi:plasmid replication initiation protein
MSQRTGRERNPLVVVSSQKQKKKSDKTEEKLVIRQKGPLEGRDEMNLVELPFSLVSYRNSKQVKTIETRWMGVGEDGKQRDFYEIVTSLEKWGLPTFQGEELLIAALELTFRQAPDDRMVHTTKYELMQLMQWPNTGQYRQTLLNTFGQVVGTTIATNHFWDKERQRYAEVSFHIIDEYRFYEDERKRSRKDGQLTLPLSYFTWGKTFWQSLQAGYVKKLDTATYFSLNSPLARRLFRYADKHMRNGGLEIDLFTLATAKLVMSGNYRYPSKIIEKLQPAIDELNDRGLADIQIIKSKTTDSGYKMAIQRSVGRSSALEQRGAGSIPKGVGEKSSVMAQALVERGITSGAVARLVDKFPHRIEKQVEIFDWIKEHQPATISDNPAGFLRRMIEKDWSAPDGFVSQTEQEEKRRSQEEAEQELLAEYRQALVELEQEVDEFVSLPPEQQIAGRLDFWENDYRRRHRREPTEKERAQRKARFLKELPDREGLFAARLKDLHYEFARKAEEQGISFEVEGQPLVE